MPLSWRDRVSKWIPKGSAWLWRLEGAVFGQRKPVTLQAEIMSLDDSSEATPVSSTLGPPKFSGTNGLSIWLLEPDQLQALRDELKLTAQGEIQFRPRVTTADGIESSAFQGGTILVGGSPQEIGLFFRSLPNVGSNFTELFASIRHSEISTNSPPGDDRIPQPTPVMIQTNLEVAFKLRIPDGSGVFLVDERRTASLGRRLGVIIDPPRPKR